MFGHSEAFSDYEYQHDENIDFVCFTDDRNLKSNFWNIVYVDSASLGPVKTSKMVKLLPHRFLKSYSRSLYIDNTVKLNELPKNIFERYRNSKMVCFEHPWWNCIYIETEKLIELGYDDEAILLRQADSYRKSHYPANHGLIAGTVLLRNHREKEIIKLMEVWFGEVLKHSYRDQMSFNYSAWKVGFKPDYFEGKLDGNDLMQWPVYTGHRLPRGFRDEAYLDLNPDLREIEMSPRQHYILYGANEGRKWSRDVFS